MVIRARALARDVFTYYSSEGNFSVSPPLSLSLSFGKCMLHQCSGRLDRSVLHRDFINAERAAHAGTRSYLKANFVITALPSISREYTLDFVWWLSDIVKISKRIFCAQKIEYGRNDHQRLLLQNLEMGHIRIFSNEMWNNNNSYTRSILQLVIS